VSIEQHARLIDEKLADITICDPGMGRSVGTSDMEFRSPYQAP
jgi:hypothetical protein